MTDNVRKFGWDWLGDARQRIECNSINIHWGYFSHEVMIKIDFAERVKMRKARSVPQEFIFCRQVKGIICHV